jgi:hypothetical protein
VPLDLVLECDAERFGNVQTTVGLRRGSRRRGSRGGVESPPPTLAAMALISATKRTTLAAI